MVDIDQLPIVVNYDLPYVAEDYVTELSNRKGGASGHSLSLVVPMRRRYLTKYNVLLTKLTCKNMKLLTMSIMNNQLYQTIN